MISCVNNTTGQKAEHETDPVLSYLSLYDSLTNSGQFTHIDYYDIGSLKGINFRVCKLSTEKDTLTVLNLSKVVKEYYSSSTENAVMIPQEIDYMINALNKIASEFDRNVTHHERYVYITKRDIQIVSNATPSQKWEAGIFVNSHKSGSGELINKSDISNLVALLKRSQDKIKELGF